MAAGLFAVNLRRNKMSVFKGKSKIGQIRKLIDLINKPQAVITIKDFKLIQIGIPWIKIEEGCKMPNFFDKVMIWIPSIGDFNKAEYLNHKTGRVWHSAHGHDWQINDASHWARINEPDEKLMPPVIEVKNGAAYINNKYLGPTCLVKESKDSKNEMD